MLETSQMIKLINQNKKEKQEKSFAIRMAKKEKKERIANVLTFIGYAVAVYMFVEIVTLLVK